MTAVGVCSSCGDAIDSSQVGKKVPTFTDIWGVNGTVKSIQDGFDLTCKICLEGMTMMQKAQAGHRMKPGVYIQDDIGDTIDVRTIARA